MACRRPPIREVLGYDGTTGTLLRWYAYGLGPNAVLSQINLGGSTRDTPIPNLLGSIVGSYDSTRALTKFDYQPYGSGNAAPQLAYAGQRVDPRPARVAGCLAPMRKFPVDIEL